jgi:hypothetical protein
LIEVKFEGDTAIGEQLMKLGRADDNINSISSESGLDGTEIITMIYNHGSDGIKLLTAIVGLIEASIKLKQTYEIRINNKPNDEDKH